MVSPRSHHTSLKRYWKGWQGGGGGRAFRAEQIRWALLCCAALGAVCQVALLQNQIALEELDNSGARVGQQGGEGERGGLSNGSASSTPSSMPGVLSLATPTTGNGDTPQHTPVPSTGERDGRNKEAKRLKMLRKWWAKSGADLSSAGTWAGKAGGAGAQALCPIVGEEAQRRAAAAGKGEGGQVSPWPLAGPDVGGGEVLWKVVVSPSDVGWRGEGAPGSCVFGTQRRQAYPVIDAGVEEGPGRAQKQWSGWLKCVAPPQVVALEQGGSLRSIAASAGLSIEGLLQLNPEILDPNKVFVGQRIAISAASVRLVLEHSLLKGQTPPAFNYAYFNLEIQAAYPVSSDIRGGVTITLTGVGFSAAPFGTDPCQVACQIGSARVAATFVPSATASSATVAGRGERDLGYLLCTTPHARHVLARVGGEGRNGQWAGCGAGEVVCGAAGLEVTINGLDLTRSGLMLALFRQPVCLPTSAAVLGMLKPFASHVLVFPGSVHAHEAEAIRAWSALSSSSLLTSTGMPMRVYLCGDHPSVRSAAHEMNLAHVGSDGEVTMGAGDGAGGAVGEDGSGGDGELGRIANKMRNPWVQSLCSVSALQAAEGRLARSKDGNGIGNVWSGVSGEFIVVANPLLKVDVDGFKLAVATSVMQFGEGVGVVGTAQLGGKGKREVFEDGEVGGVGEGDELGQQDALTGMVVLPISFVKSVCERWVDGVNPSEQSRGVFEELATRLQDEGGRVMDVSAVSVGMVMGAPQTQASRLHASQRASSAPQWTGGVGDFEKATKGAVSVADAVLRVC